MLFIFLSTILVNEFTSTKIRDTWILINRLGIEPDMEVKLKSLKNQYLLSANELAEIAVTENNNKSKYNEIYKTIRAIERNVLEGSKGRQALFYVLGNPDKSDILLANVINLIEADSLKDIIYLNFDYRSKANVPGVGVFVGRR